MQVVKKDFPPGFKGFWDCAYADDAMRIFYTNKGSMFVVRSSRVHSGT